MILGVLTMSSSVISQATPRDKFKLGQPFWVLQTVHCNKLPGYAAYSTILIRRTYRKHVDTSPRCVRPTTNSNITLSSPDQSRPVEAKPSTALNIRRVLHVFGVQIVRMEDRARDGQPLTPSLPPGNAFIYKVAKAYLRGHHPPPESIFMFGPIGGHIKYSRFGR